MALACRLGGRQVAKPEVYNPRRTVNDEIGASMIEAVQREGNKIEPGRTTIVEATSDDSRGSCGYTERVALAESLGGWPHAV